MPHLLILEILRYSVLYFWLDCSDLNVCLNLFTKRIFIGFLVVLTTTLTWDPSEHIRKAKVTIEVGISEFIGIVTRYYHRGLESMKVWKYESMKVGISEFIGIVTRYYHRGAPRHHARSTAWSGSLGAFSWDITVGQSWFHSSCATSPPS